MKTLLILLSCLIITGCGEEGTSRDQDSSPGKGKPAPAPDVSIPEPDIGTNGSRFKLTKLSVVTEKFLRLNDNIVFNGLAEQMKTQSFLHDVSLKIKTHCIVDNQKVLIKEFSRALSPSIPLIELLSPEALSERGKNYTPACGFSFKAEHKSGAAHHFELPVLPIVDYQAGRFIRFLTPSGPVKKNFPYLYMDKKAEYQIDMGIQEPINRLSLICDDFSLPLEIRPQQFIPFTVFPFESLTEKQIQKITGTKPIQQCRVFGYKNNIMMGVSFVFNLVYPFSPISVSINKGLFKKKADSLFFEVMKPNGLEEKENRPDIPIYTYRISNSRPYPVYILIEDYEKRDLKLRAYGLYHHSGGKSFYARHTEVFKLNGIYTVYGQSLHKQTKEGVFIQLQPKSYIKFSAVLNEDFAFCGFDERSKLGSGSIYWLGMIVKYPDLKIYQLVSDKTDNIPLSQNVLHELDTRSGQYFKIIGRHLRKLKKLSYRSLFFSRADAVVRDGRHTAGILSSNCAGVVLA